MGPAILAPLAISALSAGAQYYNTAQAQGRQNAANTQDIINQQRIQSQAAGQVSKLTQQIAQDNPNKIAQDATAQYISQLRTNAAGSMLGGSTTGAPTTYGQSVSAVGNTAGADPRFKAQLANDQQQVQDYGTQYAKTLGNMDAAVRQRQQEGLGMQTLQGGLDTLNAASFAQNFVDGLRAQAAGQPNPYVAMGALAGARLANAMSQNAGTPTNNAQVGAAVQNAQAAYNRQLGYYGTGS